ncbi:MAG TPA: protein kinase [Candidatus Sulfotelmatobacter sp.]|nr:protein kinase [Candidatus Sulfotelmatobacter sp.]
MDAPASKRFGRYETVAELGRGAMGVVHKARDPQIDRFVAIKTVSLWGQEPEEEKEFRMRFANEAQAAGRLHHPGIVAVFDVGENPENRDPYIVLEYVSGESLNKILGREKKLSLETALQLAIEIADALEYAHAQGVVHRDIKPANILITEAGRAKIADFGIAKLNLAHFTLPGRVLGTPAYMAPEQLSGEGCDGRSDLFSLGVILYAMVTGHSPFQGNSATTVCFKVANREPVSATALDMTLPPELDAVIGRAMAKDPEERYQRGADFANDLRQILTLGNAGSTTTSLNLAAATGTRSTAQRTATGTAHVTAVAQGEKVVRRIFSKAPIRDLVLAAATVVVLVILGAQTKLLVNSSKTDVSDSSPAGGPPLTSPPPVAQTVEPAKPAPLPTTKSTPKKNSPKPARAPKQVTAPKQVIVPTATLDLAIQHQFKDATLYIWIDDNLALTRPLHGGVQKKLVVFNGVRGVDSESLKVPAGNHALRFRAVSTDKSVDLSKTISTDFAGGDIKTLQITFDKHNATIKLNWQ